MKRKITTIRRYYIDGCFTLIYRIGDWRILFGHEKGQDLEIYLEIHSSKRPDYIMRGKLTQRKNFLYLESNVFEY
jgi:hypothetical protein